MRRLKSSALIIALIVGIAFSGILVGVVLTLGQYSKSSGQTREGRAAYRAALSGVEDGLIRMKYALAQNQLYSLYGENRDLPIVTDDSNSVDIKYDLTFKMDSISAGSDLGKYVNAGVAIWKGDPIAAQAQKAVPLLSDETLDIDLTYLMNISEDGLGSVEIFFSEPFVKSVDGSYSNQPFLAMSPRPFSATSVKIIDVSNVGEEQMVFEYINNLRSNNKVQAGNLSLCEGTNSFNSKMKQCHLQIKPQIAFSENDVDSDSNRLSGEGIASSDKYVFFKIRAKDKSGKIIDASDDLPGTLTIESVGKAGEAVRKVQAKVDASSGKYIGLLDFGVYCGTKCNMPSVERPD